MDEHPDARNETERELKERAAEAEREEGWLQPEAHPDRDEDAPEAERDE